MHLNIDFDRLRDIALKGIRRTAVFLGLGVNAARNPKFSDYELSQITQIQLVPSNADENTIKNYKSAFENWIISCGLRELIETFAVFLEGIHKSCLLMATNKGKIDATKANKICPAFERKGIEDKLKKLENQFGVQTGKKDYLISINRIRNCLTHRRGIVGVADMQDEGSLKLKWWGMELFIETPSGETISLQPPLPEEGIFLKDGGIVSVKIVDRVKEYKLGEVISLSPNDLAEICFLTQLATDEILKSAFEYAKALGIPHRAEKNTEPVAGEGRGIKAASPLASR